MSHLRVFNFSQTTPNAISRILRQYGVAHSTISKNGMALQTIKVRGKIANQPLQVVITSVIEVVAKMEPLEPTVVFSCLPESLLATIIDSDDVESFAVEDDRLDNAVRWALYEGLNPKTTIIGLHQKTPSQYIEEVSPPSFLDTYNTIKCRVNPYDLRAPMHKIAIGYLYGAVSKAETKRFLDTSLKFHAVKTLLFGPSGRNIKAAVAKARSGVSPVDAAAEFNLDGFEITYIMQSYSKLYAKAKE